MEKIFNLMFELGWAIRNFLTKERGYNNYNDNQKIFDFNNGDWHNNPTYNGCIGNVYHRSSDD